MNKIIRKEYISNDGQFILWLGFLFLLIILIINPMKWVPYDDDFAYVSTAESIAKNGIYKLNEMATANVIAQTYLAGAVSALVGPGFLNYVSVTLTLHFFGSLALYYIGRDFGLSAFNSFIVAIAYIGNFLTIKMSSTFMSDIPHISFLLISWLFYSRGFEYKSNLKILIGSLALSLAILTRQYAVLALLATVITFYFHGENRILPVLSTFLAPVVSVFIMIYFHFSHPTWAQAYSNERLKGYLTMDIIEIVSGCLWRFAASLQLIALVGLPLVFGVLYQYFRSLRNHRSDQNKFYRVFVRLSLCSAVLFFLLKIGTFSALIKSYDSIGGESILLPQLRWNLTVISKLPIILRQILTAISFLGAVHLLQLFLRLKSWKILNFNNVHPITAQLAASALLYSGFHLLFFQFGDQYLADIIPIGLLMLASILPRCEKNIIRASILIISVLITITSSIAVRGILDEQYAFWKLAEETSKSYSIAPSKVGAKWAWDCYHGAFDDYLGISNREITSNFNNFFGYLDKRRRDAKIEIINAQIQDGSALDHVIGRKSYVDSFLQKRDVVAVLKGD